MSERQSRKMRKEQPAAAPKKKDSKKVLFNAISAVIIIAFLGLAAWAITSEIKGDAPKDNNITETQPPESETNSQPSEGEADTREENQGEEE